VMPVKAGLYMTQIVLFIICQLIRISLVIVLSAQKEMAENMQTKINDRNKP